MGLVMSLLMGVSPASFAACCAETPLADNSAAIPSRTGPNPLNMAARKNTRNPSHEAAQEPMELMPAGLGQLDRIIDTRRMPSPKEES